MKKLLILSLCTFIVLPACTSSNNVSTQISPDVEIDSTVQMENPMVEVENLEEINERLGISLGIPEGSMLISAFVISGETAEINFMHNDVTYCYRASKVHEGQVLHGIYDIFEANPSSTQVSSDVFSYDIKTETLSEGKGFVSIATINMNDKDPVYATLNADGSIDKETMSTILIDLCRIIKIQTLG